jgi:alpha-amylase
MKGILIYITFTLLVLGVLLKTKDEWKGRVIYQILTDRFVRSTEGGDCNDLHKYCGGTFKGITKNIDYISGMGFNAIWISPILTNTPNSYHGYHMSNLYEINPYFGTKFDLEELITECHNRDIWVMLDVVANHIGPVGQDFRGINPFNDPSHYHDYCNIDQQDFHINQWKVEVIIY